MLQLFRSFFSSKIGVVITLAFLALIALAFASMDVANTGLFGGVAGSDRVAVVGDRRIDAADFTQNVTTALNQARQQDPTVTMEGFIANGGAQGVLTQMLSRAALAEFGREHGLRAGKRLIDSEIRQIGAFRDASGNFSQDAYRGALRQQGLSDATVREDLAMGLFARQLVAPLGVAPTMPQGLSRRYAQLLRESRRGAVGLVPSAAFAPKESATAQQLEAYYQANRARYIRPERRVIRFASFGEEALGTLPAPTEAQVARRYQRDAVQYQAQENRTFTQLIAPSQNAAQAIVRAVRGGTSLEAAARGQGLATAEIGPLDREALTGSTSAAVARAGFAAVRGAVAEPAQGGLGWYVLRVDALDTRPVKSLAMARSAIATTLAQEQREAALGDLTARVEEELEDGRNLDEVAEELKLQLTATPPVTAAGQIYGSSENLPAVLEPVIANAFEMSENEPQLAVIEPGRQFLVYDISDTTASAVAPLAQIRKQVEAAWRRDRGFAGAQQAAQRIMQRVTDGQSLAEAIQAEAVSLPAPEAVSLSREDIAQQGQVPPALALMFSMAQGTVKRLPVPFNNGWFIVELEEIVTPDMAVDDPLVGATASQLRNALAEEYVTQFIKAVEAETGMERNQTGIDAVIAQLTGRTG